MNSSFYIFGRFNGKEEQYPVDYTKELFQSLPQRHHFTHSQLVIHRDGKLMYYCYMRKLDQENYLGFCLLLNDAMITEFPALFELFDHAVTQLALNGEIIKISDRGEIVSNTESLLTNQQAIKQTASSLFAQLSPLVAAKKTLPAQNYSVSKDETKTFMLTANASWIVESSLTNAYTIITKEDNSSNLDSYQQTIKRLQKEREELLAKQQSPTDKSNIAKGLWIAVLIIMVIGFFIYTSNRETEEETFLSEMEAFQETNAPKTASVSVPSAPTNSTDKIKQNPQNRILAESSDALYYLGEQWLTLYRFDKREKYTQAFSYDNTMMYADPHDVYFYGDLLILIGNNNANAGMNMDIALFFNTKSKRFVNELYATTIERKDNVLITSKNELVVDNGYSAGNEYFYWNEYYDLGGNLIDGKTIRGEGSIGKYQIEMSMHCLSGQISGWYKYEGHTNYMTIKGTIIDNDYFNFVEYNDKGERFGTFTGYADFESQTLSGSFHKGSVELDFRISPYEMW